MTLPAVTDPDAWQKLQFEWRTSFEDLGTYKEAFALGNGFMIAGVEQDPCPLGVHGFHYLPWDNFPVVMEFPDIANDPFFAGTTYMHISVTCSSFFYGPSSIVVAQACTGLITNFPASMHMYLALDSADGPIATDPNGELFEFYFANGEWSGHDRPWNFEDRFMDAAYYELPVVGALPHYCWVLDSGFFENYYPELAITVRASTVNTPPAPFHPPPAPPPPTEGPPMPGCAAGGTPTTVEAGEPSGGVVPIKPVKP